MTLEDIPGIKDSDQEHLTGFLEDLLDAAVSGIIVTDKDGIIKYANPAFLRMFKYDKSKQIVGENAAGLFVSDRVKEFADIRCSAEFESESTGEAVVEHKDGSVCSVEVSFSEAKDKQGRILGKMASFVDISKRKQTEKKLRKSEKKLRELSRKTVESQENERKLVAKELHDSVGGNLAAIKFALEQKMTLPGCNSDDDVVSLEKIVTSIKDTITEVRRISNHLMPSMLEDLGLVETIRWFCREQEAYYQNILITTKLDVDESTIQDLFKITIFRVLQEAMTNALRHGEADTIEVSLTDVGDGFIKLCVTDDGRGFDPENVSSDPKSLGGFGLKGMSDRAEICGGTFEISSAIDKGTQVTLSLPHP